jgi:polygalacturonase
MASATGTDGSGYSRTPVLLLTSFGGVGDGAVLNTASFARACAAAESAGGGVIVVPPGTWRTGSVRLPSRTALRIEAGATVLGSRDPGDYPLRARPWEGGMVRAPDSLIWAADSEDVAIVGEGTVDGQGEGWWEAVRANPSTQRPRLVSFESCRRVKIEGVRLTRSPSWTVHPWRCQDVRIAGVTIVNPPDGPNTDGIDPESCADVRITDCLIDVGDDAIVLKAGAAGGDIGGFPPCERVLISGCSIRHGHGGIVIGSEMSGGVRDVVVSNCALQGTDRGIRIKTRRGRGGVVENLTVTNVVMRAVGCPLVIHSYYRYTGLREGDRAWAASLSAQPVTETTPVIRGVRIHGLTACDVGGPCLAYLHGLPESPIRAVTVSDCDLTHAETPDPAMREPAMMLIKGKGDYATGGLFATHVAGLSLRNVHLHPRAGSAIVLDGVAGYDGPER